MTNVVYSHPVVSSEGKHITEEQAAQAVRSMSEPLLQKHHQFLRKMVAHFLRAKVTGALIES